MPRRSRNAPLLPAWAECPPEQLFPIGALDATPLAPVARRTRYGLVSSGQLRAVRIGARIFVSKGAIIAFIEGGGAPAMPALRAVGPRQ